MKEFYVIGDSGGDPIQIGPFCTHEDAEKCLQKVKKDAGTYFTGQTPGCPFVGTVATREEIMANQEWRHDFENYPIEKPDQL